MDRRPLLIENITSKDGRRSELPRRPEAIEPSGWYAADSYLQNTIHVEDLRVSNAPQTACY